MWWVIRARRTLRLPWTTLAAPGPRRWRRAGVSGAVGIVALVALAVGVAAGVLLPSPAGADGLRSNAFHYRVPPCDRYGWTGVVAWGLEGISEPGKRLNRWNDRIPVAREAGREIVFADGNALYAAAVQGTQLGRLVREDAATYMRASDASDASDAGGFLQTLRSLLRRLGVSTANVDGRRSRYDDGPRSRYGLEGIVSFDVSRADGALVYATCWSYQPDGGDPEIAVCTRAPQVRASVDECAKNPPRREVHLAYPGGDVLFNIGGDLHEVMAVRPDEGTATRLALGNHPTWSPDGRHIAFVSYYWGTGDGPAQRRSWSRVQIMAADGTDRRSIELPPDRYTDYPPQWSPDGTRLAFRVYEYERQGSRTVAIYTVRADGTGLQRLAAAAHSNPAWSPDGTRLAFVQAHRNGEGESLHLYTMAADGTDVRQITAIGSWRPGHGWGWSTLAWSPDGSRLLYWCLDATCVVGLDGQLVGKFPHFATELPAWSADGRRIVLYNAAHGDRDDVVLASVAPDGSDWRALVHAGADRELVADPAGDLLLPMAGPAVCRAGVVVPAPAQHPGLVADCEVLVALRAALVGRAARHWQTNRPLAEWAGVVVDGAPPRVRALVLRAETISDEGLLPRIAELTALERLELSGNGLTGAIPAAWGALSQLYWLDLSGNQLTGTIPAELGQLRKLVWLYLDNNQLTGAIPAALGQLLNLKLLRLHDNQLTGTIPAALGQLEQLRELYLNNNQLTGAVPAALGQLQSLEGLSLDNNQLTGTIPAALGRLQSPRHLWLAGNQLTGCIPVGLKRVPYNDLAQLKLPDC